MNAWIWKGLVAETTATGPNGNRCKVLTTTRPGAVVTRELAVGRGLDAGLRIRPARARRSEAAHDAAIYRACRKEHRRLLQQGAAVRRIRLDAELKSTVARRSKSARVRDGRRAADAERQRVATELGLPIDARGPRALP